jgi:hypothetical protein
MKRIYIKAFNALKKMGVPVYEHVDDNGNFSIDAEASEADGWADYYTRSSDWIFGVSPSLDKVLTKHGLYGEWVNPGRLSVYQG